MALSFSELADTVVVEAIKGWGERPNYHASLAEAMILIGAGGQIIREVDHQDGTFLYEIKYKEITFLCTANNKISLTKK